MVRVVGFGGGQRVFARKQITEFEKTELHLVKYREKKNKYTTAERKEQWNKDMRKRGNLNLTDVSGVCSSSPPSFFYMVVVGTDGYIVVLCWPQ